MRVLIALMLLGCGDVGAPLSGACAETGECLFVASVIDAPTPDGIMSFGANLDARISERGDAEACRKADFEHPRTGEPGIDNGLAELLPLIDSQLEESVRDALVTEINRGGLSLLIGLRDANSTDDGNVALTLYRGLVPPGNELELVEGSLAAGQTFDIDASTLPPIEVPGEIIDGRIVATLPELTIPVGVPDGMLNLVIEQPQISAAITAEGLEDGEISGALSVAQLVTGLAPFVGESVDARTLTTLLRGAADLADPSGECSGISVAFTFRAVDAVAGETL